MHKFRLIIFSLLLLLMQSATLVHAIDHQLVDHAEWCEALKGAEKQSAFDVAGESPELQATRQAFTVLYSSQVPRPTWRAYSSRAPPQI